MPAGAIGNDTNDFGMLDYATMACIVPDAFLGDFPNWVRVPPAEPHVVAFAISDFVGMTKEGRDE